MRQYRLEFVLAVVSRRARIHEVVLAPALMRAEEQNWFFSVMPWLVPRKVIFMMALFKFGVVGWFMSLSSRTQDEA